MSLSSYGDLKQAIQDWTQREDLSQRTGDFIALVESDLNHRLRVREMLTRDTFSADAQYETLPTDFLEMSRLTITSTTPDKELRFLTPQMMSEMRDMNSTSGEPIYYSIVGDEVEFLPTPADTYTVERLYFAEITALSDTNTSNWVLANHPEAYLHGCLAHAYTFVFDESRAAVHDAEYQKAIETIIRSDKRQRHGQRPVMSAKPIGGGSLRPHMHW